MTKSIDISIDGVEVTLKAIKLFDMDTKAKLIDVVKASAVKLQQNAKAKAPVAKTTITKGKGKREDLKKSIRPKYFDGGLSATVVPRKPKGSHRHLVEYGTVSRRTKKGANRGVMPKMPFMAPAERQEDASYNAKVKEVVDRDKTV
ncbi:HK97-gp10 family putative phage morphogenesis protein [Sporolactobacillus sp. STCC-11]|uniref:HK97-gp10 family putative phage morphogenesis protein n=1 Tax=Sporolactobacillus caesalpiniae TaxID=3230362 RepID=UPI003393B5C2